MPPWPNPSNSPYRSGSPSTPTLPTEYISQLPTEQPHYPCLLGLLHLPYSQAASQRKPWAGWDRHSPLLSYLYSGLFSTPRACLAECMLISSMYPQQMEKLRLATMNDVPRICLQGGVTCHKRSTSVGRLAGALQSHIT